MDESRLNDLAEELRASRKYRDLDLPAATVLSLLEQELPRHKSEKDALKAVRQKLHNVVAPYLGDPDFEFSHRALEEAFGSGDPLAVPRACTSILVTHLSTMERMPVILGFFPSLWEVTGTPASILDLACGLNPFAFPWMGLPASVQYHAYDLNAPRVALINHFFRLQGLAELAEQRDILVNPPEIEADVALFMKEAHRFEQRQHGCNKDFWRALKVKWLLVSLPTESLSKRHSLIEGHRRLVQNTLAGLDWPVTEVEFPGEVVFCIHKESREE